MADVSFYRWLSGNVGSYCDLQEKLQNAKEIAVTKLRYPSVEELHAFELAARRARAAEIARLLKAGASATKSIAARAIRIVAARAVRHA